jgi:hypothetical protein
MFFELTSLGFWVIKFLVEKPPTPSVDFNLSDNHSEYDIIFSKTIQKRK